jgi:hypothetical protein
MVGRLAGVLVGGLALVACEIIEPHGPFSYEDMDSAVDGWADDRDAYVDDAQTEAATADGGDAGVADDAPDGDGGPDLSIPNPCPRAGAPCCGYDPDAGPGPLYLYGSGRRTPGICDKCLALGCEPDTQFCCTSEGDTPPQCWKFSEGKLCSSD